jgi:acyl-CoA reductase-like NAD-dependent aldehyde dehydrogenase
MFSMVQGVANEVGEALVTAEGIKAVGFTGSLRGGRALFDLAAGRPEPIPVYAEMGSINPVFVTQAALQRDTGKIAEGFAGSMTLGTGQFCTKPGLVFVPDGEAGRRFAQLVSQAAQRTRGTAMLNARSEVSSIPAMAPAAALRRPTVTMTASSSSRSSGGKSAPAPGRWPPSEPRGPCTG